MNFELVLGLLLSMSLLYVIHRLRSRCSCSLTTINHSYLRESYVCYVCICMIFMTNHNQTGVSRILCLLFTTKMNNFFGIFLYFFHFLTLLFSLISFFLLLLLSSFPWCVFFIGFYPNRKIFFELQLRKIITSIPFSSDTFKWNVFREFHLLIILFTFQFFFLKMFASKTENTKTQGLSQHFGIFYASIAFRCASNIGCNLHRFARWWSSFTLWIGNQRTNWTGETVNASIDFDWPIIIHLKFDILCFIYTKKKN